MGERRVPMRRCVGCMTSFPKSDVTRFIATDGKIIIDPLGKMNGRGAYLCRSLDCFDMALRKRRLTYALGVSMTEEESALLRDEYTKVVSDAEVSE